MLEEREGNITCLIYKKRRVQKSKDINLIINEMVDDEMVG